MLRRNLRLFSFAPVAVLAAARPVGRGSRPTGSKAPRGGIGADSRPRSIVIQRKGGSPVRTHGEAGIVSRL
jgi:hypothetical protein